MSTYGFGKKSKVASLDPIMLEDELWIRQREKPSQNRGYWFFENRTAETFRFLNFEVCSVFKKTNIRNFHRIPHTPNFKFLIEVKRSNVKVGGSLNSSECQSYSLTLQAQIFFCFLDIHVITIYVIKMTVESGGHINGHKEGISVISKAKLLTSKWKNS